MSNMSGELRNKLRKSGYSLTRPRQEVFSALQNQEPQTMRELVEALPTIDRSSVYRTIEMFVKLGVVERLQFGWKYKIELSDEFSHHHHHMTCISCHKVIAIDENKDLEDLVHSLAHKAQFEATGHQIEIRGICKDCAT